MREQLTIVPSPLSYNLLDGGLRVRLLAEPTLIRQHVQAKNLRNCVIFIDEIQKCPGLLDEVHLLIEERGIRFLLTGSSVRTLKRAGTNLLERNMERGLLPPSLFVGVSYSDALDAGADRHHLGSN